LENTTLGKVRTVLVKRLARELVDRYHDSFSTDFDQNKEVLDELLTNTTKRLRNRIAGYITRLMILRQDEDVIVA
jgi:small subunit ribosomal protein S17e